MATEHTEPRPDGTVERTTTTDRVAVKGGGGGAGTIVAVVIGLLLVGVVAYFLMNMSRNDDIETNAVAGAAESVGNAADRVGDAVTPADK